MEGVSYIYDGYPVILRYRSLCKATNWQDHKNNSKTKDSGHDSIVFSGGTNTSVLNSNPPSLREEALGLQVERRLHKSNNNVTRESDATETHSKVTETYSKSDTKAIETVSKAMETNLKATQTDLKTTETDSNAIETDSKAMETNLKATKADVKATETYSNLIETDSNEIESNLKATKTDLKATETESKAIEIDSKAAKNDSNASKTDPNATKSDSKGTDFKGTESKAAEDHSLNDQERVLYENTKAEMKVYSAQLRSTLDWSERNVILQDIHKLYLKQYNYYLSQEKQMQSNVDILRRSNIKRQRPEAKKSQPQDSVELVLNKELCQRNQMEDLVENIPGDKTVIDLTTEPEMMLSTKGKVKDNNIEVIDITDEDKNGSDKCVRKPTALTELSDILNQSVKNSNLCPISNLKLTTWTHTNDSTTEHSLSRVSIESHTDESNLIQLASTFYPVNENHKHYEQPHSIYGPQNHCMPSFPHSSQNPFFTDSNSNNFGLFNTQRDQRDVCLAGVNTTNSLYQDLKPQSHQDNIKGHLMRHKRSSTRIFLPPYDLTKNPYSASHYNSNLYKAAPTHDGGSPIDFCVQHYSDM